MKLSTDFTPSKKFMAAIEHLSSSKQAKIVDKWQMMMWQKQLTDLDKALVNDGIDTGSFYANLKFHA
jgi:hypothetical protein